MPEYEDVIRPFNVTSDVEFTDVWDFYSVRPYKGKHPAEKPQDMLDHCIRSSSFENDIVLDCFAGSGSTAISALRNNRKSISIELEGKWVESISERLNRFSTEKELAKISSEQIMKLTGKSGINKKVKEDSTRTLFTV